MPRRGGDHARASGCIADCPTPLFGSLIHVMGQYRGGVGIISMHIAGLVDPIV